MVKIKLDHLLRQAGQSVLAGSLGTSGASVPGIFLCVAGAFRSE